MCRIVLMLQHLCDSESCHKITVHGPPRCHLTAYVLPLSGLMLTPVTYLDKLSAAWAVATWGDGCCHESTRGNEWAQTQKENKRPAVMVSLFINATALLCSSWKPLVAVCEAASPISVCKKTLPVLICHWCQVAELQHTQWCFQGRAKYSRKWDQWSSFLHIFWLIIKTGSTRDND